MDKNYGPSDLAPLTLETMRAACVGFRAAVLATLGEDTANAVDSEQGCHHFWLTRNGHGAGFWDGDWERGDEITEVCKRFPEVTLYVGDDGQIHSL